MEGTSPSLEAKYPIFMGPRLNPQLHCPFVDGETAPGVPWLALHLGTSESLSEARLAQFQRKPGPQLDALDEWTTAAGGDETPRSAAGVSIWSPGIFANPHRVTEIFWLLGGPLKGE